MADLQRKHDTIRDIHHLQLPESPIGALEDATKLKQWFIQSVHCNIWRSNGIK